MEGNEKSEQDNKAICGIIMPISAIDNCSENHWLDVKRIITESVESVGFKADLVSDADDVGIIQNRIINNLYENPVAVCDVSCKNPNVMFELGMRLAFDKPTIIIKDDQTNYSFDTSPIEHLEYPRDLRYTYIVDFEKRLAEKVKSTHEKALKDSNYSTFLKHFGNYSVSKLVTKNMTKEDYILEELSTLKRLFRRNSEFNAISLFPLSTASNTYRHDSSDTDKLGMIIHCLDLIRDDQRIDINQLNRMNIDTVAKSVHQLLLDRFDYSITLKELRQVLPSIIASRIK